MDFKKDTDILDVFASNIFTYKKMEKYLSKDKCKKLKGIIDNQQKLNNDLAKDIAEAMKNWAIENGATHYTHWFVPLTGTTAEKHNSFLSLSKDGEITLDFPIESLIMEESDASSFPTGGLRSTFEARGFTKWDYTSPAFLKENDSGMVLCIPTTFSSCNGCSLDKKQPLMNSSKALNEATIKLMRLFGDTVTTSGFSVVGAEQEYFLIDEEVVKKRKDLILTGRTLFGSNTAKPQDMEYHYLGSLDGRIAVFMQEVDIALWKLGILAKTKHNERAPRQFELAPYFEEVNLACDHNQLIMETLRKTAKKNGFECLLHEKPFKNINGSGKHNNWSINTNLGENLLSQGKTVEKNARFLTIICAIVSAVNTHKDLLKASSMSASNDNRLSGYEAPPAIISVYLGERLTEIIENIIKNSDKSKVTLKDFKLPHLNTNDIDRNRTSPMAFVGNRFEFRMLGSSASISVCNTVLNTIVANEFFKIIDELKDSKDFYSDLHKLLAKKFKEHFKIIYNGDGYSKEWIHEAENREISNVNNAPEAFKAFISDSSIELFTKYNVYTKDDLLARHKIKVDKYINLVKIEARTLLEIVHSQILPSSIKYSGFLSRNIGTLEQVKMGTYAETKILENVSNNVDSLYKNSEILQKNIDHSYTIDDLYEKAMFYHKTILENMLAVRENIDNLEKIVDRDVWGIPVYTDILHGDGAKNY